MKSILAAIHKASLYVGMAALLALTGGCCTQSVVFNSNFPEIQLFHPSAVYQLTNDDRFALEGIFSNRPPTTYINTTQLHGYLLLPQTNLNAQCFVTNGNHSLAVIKGLPPETTHRLKPKDKLPSSYAKIYDLPQNNIGLEINQTHPHRGGLILLPFAFAIDVVAFPVELPVMYAFGKYGPG